MLEMSYTSATASVSTPPVPRFWSLRFSRILENRGSLLSFGILTWTPARNPVPRFEGQVRMYPRRSFHMNSQPRSWIRRSTSFSPRQNRSNTLFILPPFSIEITLVWSSSLIQMRNVLSLLCIDEPLLVLLRHLGQPVVAAGQVPLEALQGHDGHVLHLPPLGPGAGWRQAQPADAAARAHPR